MYNSFIWDFDGTIFDSYPHITSAMAKMASNNGIEGTLSEMRAALEVSFATAYNVFHLTREQIDEFRAYEKDVNFKPEVTPFEKTEMVLKAVLEKGGKNYIYTHRGQASTIYYLEKYDLSKYFSALITADDGFPLKPNPDALLHLSEKFCIDKQKALMIGDREIDVLSGVNAGMDGCLITNKTNESCAKYIVSDISEILKLI